MQQSFCRAFRKETEDAASATAHRGIVGTGCVELLLDMSHCGMLRKDALLEVVADERWPLGKGVEDALGQEMTGEARVDVSVCLTCGYEVIGLDEQEPPSTEVEGYGAKLVSNPRSIDGAVADKKGTVGSQTGGKALQLIVG